MNTRVVILAAGASKRMNSGIPKVLITLKGKPMIQYTVDAVAASGIDARPIVVVGKYADAIRSVLGDRCEYVHQKERRGTADAVHCARDILQDNTDKVIVLCGDQPFVSAETIRKLSDLHQKENCALTMMTTTVPDFTEWRATFYDFGRILRDKDGAIKAIIEKKDASPEELEIKEVNPSFFCFDAKWLWHNLGKITDNNAAGEFYLTDLVQIAIDSGECIASMNISPRESIGINTPEQLEQAKKLI